MEIRNTEISGLTIVANVSPTPPNNCGPNNNGTYPNETVTGSLTGSTVWGDNTYGYTDDSDFNKAIVHSGLAFEGQTVTIKKTSVGIKNNFPSTTQNGITTTAYTFPWCGVTIQLV
jgi:LCCL domain